MLRVLNTRPGREFRNRRGAVLPAIITADTLPSLAAADENDTPADVFTGGSYSSSATGQTGLTGVATYLVNGSAVASSYDLQGGDILQVTELVEDSAGNTRMFGTGAIAVTAIATPVATPDTAETYIGSDAITIDALANDANADEITAASADVGSVTIGSAPDYLLSYTPPASGAGTTAAITYTAEGAGGADQGIVTVSIFEAIEAGETTAINATVNGTLSFLLEQVEDAGGVVDPGIYRGGKSPIPTIRNAPAWVSQVGDSIVIDDSGGPASGTLELQVTDPVAPTITLTLPITLSAQLEISQSGSETIITTSEATYTATLGEGQPWPAGDYTVVVADVVASDGPVQMPGAPAKVWDDGTQDVLQYWYLTDQEILEETSIEWFDGADGAGSLLAAATQIAPSGWASVVLTLKARSDASTVVGTTVVTVNLVALAWLAPSVSSGDAAATYSAGSGAPAAPPAPSVAAGDTAASYNAGA